MIDNEPARADYTRLDLRKAIVRRITSVVRKWCVRIRSARFGGSRSSCSRTSLRIVISAESSGHLGGSTRE
jgi:hypothetical protein